MDRRPTTDVELLPHVDEHAVEVRATAGRLWAALTEIELAPGVAAVYARAVGCADTRRDGPRPLDEGSTMPGFRVVRSRPTTELVLAGSHRFSTYALLFRVEERAPALTCLRAETRALFPGAPGAAYRALVLGTGAHVLGVRRILRDLTRRAEATVG